MENAVSDARNGPDPATRHPLAGHPRVGFLRPLVDAPGIEVGDYTCYDDPDGPRHFVERCVLHHYEHPGDRLVIGRFCAIATGVRFVMNGANHDMRGVSACPFDIFGHGWDVGYDAPAARASMSRGDTVVGNDVWIGMDALLMPGITIGDGAIGWWDWDVKRIARNLDAIRGTDIDALERAA